MSESTPSMTIEQLSGFTNLVITQPRCPFCVKAKDLLDDRGTEYTTLVLGQDLEKPEMIAFIEQVANTTVRTVPQIILDGKYIGGHDDLVAFLARQDDAAEADMSDFEL
ncbi:glutaredoxin [Photobacterium swingsii]|uniref:Glutaredoxin n=1 Tax=Photobacterium swingsii TaxID=680026 RepID=A0A0J8XTN8_9GAMM|nr:glutaredoxin domain-containing protein [Photobacterium swingsii]KMV28704.1 glutaredoxin [Photobacterium swingsii]PSW26170.1 glutaredoxin [Photobacterium swingsii]